MSRNQLVLDKSEIFSVVLPSSFLSLRAVPSTMVRPIILGAAASSNLLDGMKNQIR